MPLDSTRSTRPTPDPIWKTLVEFSLPNQSGSDRLAGERVAAAVRGLNLSHANTERLKTALVEATLNAIKPDHPPEGVICIRVLISEQAIPAQVISQGKGLIPDSQTSDQGASSASGQLWQRGWGFFLIRKRENEAQAPGERLLSD
jgi:anti-sigma regulatory factor (Ser/Thr protein kinase)